MVYSLLAPPPLCDSKAQACLRLAQMLGFGLLMKGTKDFAGQTLDTLVFPSIPLGASCTLGVLMGLLQAEGSIENYLPELTVQQKGTGPFWKGMRGRGGPRVKWTLSPGASPSQSFLPRCLFGLGCNFMF